MMMGVDDGQVVVHVGLLRLSSRCLPASAKAGVTGIQRSACSGVCGWLDTGDKPRYDKGFALFKSRQ